MLQNSFVLLEKVGRSLEQNIWKQGIRDWDSFLTATNIKGISKSRKLYYDRRLKEAKKELYSLNSAYFIDLLPSSEMWRLYDFFSESAVFLDIETTGIYVKDRLIMIGLYDGVETRIMFWNSLDFHKLKEELSRYKVMVTFNGSSFDLPFLNKRYPGMLPRIPHFDVKSITRKAGLNGGLKDIEKCIGIKRNGILEKFRGGDALSLWRMYRATGDEYYLNLLIEYNEYDLINLKKVADYAARKIKESIAQDVIDV